MTSRKRSPILPLIWLCLAVLLIPITLRVLYVVRLTQRQCQSGPLERAILQNDLPALRARLDQGVSPNTRLELPSIASVSTAAVWKNVLHGDSGLQFLSWSLRRWSDIGSRFSCCWNEARILIFGTTKVLLP